MLQDEVPNNAIITDSSRIACGFDCPRKRDKAYAYEGRGIVPVEAKDDLLIGSALHTFYENVWQGMDFSDALDHYAQEITLVSGATLDGEPRWLEWMWHGWGLMRGFCESQLPALRKLWRVGAVEREFVAELGTVGDRPLVVACRPDMLMRDLDGKLYNHSIKSSHYERIERYARSAQLSLEAAAVEDTIGEPISGTYIVLLDKGQRQGPLAQDGERTGWRLNSPYCYGWVANGELLPRWRSGAVKTPLWTMVDEPPRAEGNQVPAITLHGPLQGVDFAELRDEVLQVEEMFAEGWRVRNLSNCRNDGGYGKTCPYESLCFGLDVGLEGFMPRPFNHPVEARLYLARSAAHSGKEPQ